MLLPGVTSNLTGMLVYNTTTTGGAGVNTIGIYFWNGATWVKASLPSTSAADSGRFLMSNGSTWIPALTLSGIYWNNDSLKSLGVPHPITSMAVVLDTTILITSKINTLTFVYARGIQPGDLCYNSKESGIFTVVPNADRLVVYNHYLENVVNYYLYVRCLRLTF